jgi:hypothetical protein
MRRSARWVLGLAVLFVTPAPALAQKATIATSKVERVLVYSDQARVYHAASVPGGKAAQKVALVDLPNGAALDSVRVEAKTAEVLRVEVIQTRGRLPRQVKAADLLKRLERVTDRLQDLDAERQILESELQLLDSLALRRERPQQGRAPAEGLFADVWRRILTWMDGRSSRVRARLGALAAERLKQVQAVHKLQVEAQALDPDTAHQPVHRVVAALKAPGGRHRVVVSYLVGGVRWVPAYDLRYDPRSRSVEAAYYAVVNQRSGEDWTKAALRFSTARPTRLVAIPELPTLTLGRKRDFMPQPRRRDDPAPVAWNPPAPPEVQDQALAQLRQLLARAQGRAEATGEEDRDADGVPDVDDLLDSGVASGKKRPVYKPRPRPVTINGELMRPEAAPSTPAAQAPPPPAPPAEPMAVADEAESKVYARRPSPARSAIFGRRASYVPQESVPWTEEGYRPPAVDPDLPAAAAKGYRFTLYAPGRHTVAADGGSRRIPLLRKRLKVRPFYSILPGATKYAYLMAEVKNTTGRPILRGHANLFAGEMFSGRSWLNTALPGRTITLPLGVDDAVKVERNARQKTVVEGMIFKDDVSEYTVEIEVANHHRYPIQVEVEDQIPVKQGEKVEVKAFSSAPKMKRDEKEGTVTWKGKVAASSVKKLKFSFQIVRPKDWELRQHGG